MKLVSYSMPTPVGEFFSIGALAGSSVIDLNLGYAACLAAGGTTGRAYEAAAAIVPADMLEFIRGGRLSLEAAFRTIDFVSQCLAGKKLVTGPRGEKIVHDLSEVKLLAPVRRPNSIRDTQSFEGHIKGVMAKLGRTVPEGWYQSPCYYKGNPDTVIGTDEPALWPDYIAKFDYELEFGIYIGKKGKNISAREAPDYIAGYTVFNDFSGRDVLNREIPLLGPAKGKDFDGGNVMGPCLVTPDEFDPSREHAMVGRINGEVWSRGKTTDMYWSFPQIIEHISRAETLYPGDFIGSGTVGSGSGIEHDRWLKPGDVVELEVEGIGIIRNRVTRV